LEILTVIKVQKRSTMSQVKTLEMGKKFKDTPIGNIPVDWEMVQLRKITEVITKGTTPTTYEYRYREDGVVFLRVENITESGHINLKEIKHITNESHEFLNRSKLEVGDILFSIAGAVGRCALVSSDILPANINQAIALIRIKNKEALDLKFVLQILLSKSVKTQITLEATSLAQTNLNLEQVKNITIPSPPIEEQKKIAEILSAVDDAIEVTDKIIEKTKALKKGLMQKLLTRGIGHKKIKKTELGEIPEEWEIQKIENIVSENKNAIKSGPFGPSLKKSMYVRKGYKVYGQEQVIPNDFSIGNYYINKEKFKELKDFEVNPGDILISLVGTFGKVSVVPDKIEEGIINPRLLKISPDTEKVIPNFLKILLTPNLLLNQIIKYTHGQTMGILNTKIIKQFLFPIPPVPEQKRIISILAGVEEEISNEQKRRKVLIHLKKALMQVLLTGKVRVRLN